MLLACLGGCRQSARRQSGPLNAGPYPECRSIVEWVRVKHDDPDATVLRWGPREEQSEEGASEGSAPVLIEVHYQATIGKIDGGHWKQTLRVIGRHITEDTPPVAE